MAEPQEQFDDPNLRRALKRALGKPAAPAHLRDKIASLIAGGPMQMPEPRRAPSRWRLPEMPQVSFRVGALAAMVLIAVGLAGMQTYSYIEEFFPGAHPVPAPPRLAAAVTSDVSKAHDNGGMLSTEPLSAGKDLATVRAKLTDSTKLAVFASTIDGGWEFKGGGLSQVGSKTAAQVQFTRGDQTASIFTMPGPDLSCVTNEYFELDGPHAIAAAVCDRAMYVVVVTKAGSAAAPAADAQAILRHIECHLPEPIPAPTAPSTKP